MFQNRIDLSSEPAAAILLSGLTATQVIPHWEPSAADVALVMVKMHLLESAWHVADSIQARQTVQGVTQPVSIVNKCVCSAS